MNPLQKTTPRVFGLSTESLRVLSKANPFYKTLYNAAKRAPDQLAHARRVVRQMQIETIFKTYTRSKNK